MNNTKYQIWKQVSVLTIFSWFSPQVEQSLSAAVAAASSPDLPVDMEDPFSKPAKMCVLCPRRYAEGQAPQADYRNPKLLSQFVSAHTGLVYGSHITGLCSAMQVGGAPSLVTLSQEQVEQEIKNSQFAGFMSTRVKSKYYLQDPQLFNSSRPVKPNPF